LGVWASRSRQLNSVTWCHSAHQAAEQQHDGHGAACDGIAAADVWFMRAAVGRLGVCACCVSKQVQQCAPTNLALLLCNKQHVHCARKAEGHQMTEGHPSKQTHDRVSPAAILMMLERAAACGSYARVGAVGWACQRWSQKRTWSVASSRNDDSVGQQCARHWQYACCEACQR
jgi:hypothetical protein